MYYLKLCYSSLFYVGVYYQRIIYYWAMTHLKGRMAELPLSSPTFQMVSGKCAGSFFKVFFQCLVLPPFFQNASNSRWSLGPLLCSCVVRIDERPLPFYVLLRQFSPWSESPIKIQENSRAPHPPPTRIRVHPDLWEEHPFRTLLCLAIVQWALIWLGEGFRVWAICGGWALVWGGVIFFLDGLLADHLPTLDDPLESPLTN